AVATEPVASPDADDEHDSALERIAEFAVDSDEPEEPTVFDPGATAQTEIPPALPPADPFAVDVERKLAGLFFRYEFRLAVHLLRAARRVFPDRTFAFGEAELRLAAMSGHNNHATMQGSDLLARLLREALSAIEALSADSEKAVSDDATVARRIVLH